MEVANNIYANQYHDTTKRFRGFWHLFLVWRGSVAKLIWHDLLLFLLLFYSLNMVYIFWFINDEVYRELFEIVCIYCSRFQKSIPIEFLTGFYVTQVLTRYWDQFVSLQWPDELAMKLVSFVPGQSTYHRTLRRTVMRYVNLSTVLVYRLVSCKVHARFPTYQSMIDANLLLPEEASRLKAINQKTPHESTWIPFVWAMELLRNARDEEKIKVEAPIFSSLIGSFDYLLVCNKKIFNYGWVNFPLGYTQVATFAVYAYFFIGLFAGQFLIPNKYSQDNSTFPNIPISYSSQEPYVHHTPNMYIPIFSILEFICYMGWIKVAETLLNPWGDDDEDFQINYLIDRNFQVSYFIVDSEDLGRDVPVKIVDPFLSKNIPIPSELPYRKKCGKRVQPTKNTNVPKREKRSQFATNARNYFLFRRMHRNQTTMSRLRSLNANAGDKNVYPEGSFHRNSFYSSNTFQEINFANKHNDDSLTSINTTSTTVNSLHDLKSAKVMEENKEYLQVPSKSDSSTQSSLNKFQNIPKISHPGLLQPWSNKMKLEDKTRRHSSIVNPGIMNDEYKPTMAIVDESEPKMRRFSSSGHIIHTLSHPISYV